MTKLRCSIVINTYNREAYLRRLLPSLERLAGPSFEVIVVNGPSTDGTSTYLAEYAERIKLINCPDRNLSKSRNLGIAAAAGDIVVFIDDDALPADKNWLAYLLRVFEHDTDGNIAAVGGSVLHRDTNRYEFNGGITSEYGFQKFGSIDEFVYGSGSGEWIVGVPGGNVAFRRDVLVMVGGFDEFFVYYLDEADVCARLTRSGYQIVYEVKSVVRHYSGPSDVRGGRKNIIERNWYLITRSDSYFAIKNSRGCLIDRVIKTIRFAPKKHFFQEMKPILKDNRVPFRSRLRVVTQWIHGLYDGIMSGVFKRRQLAEFAVQPPPFLPFRCDCESSKKLRIAILTRTTPFHAGYGGIARYSFDLAVGLHALGHTVDLFCADEQAIQHYALGFTIHGISTAEIERSGFHSQHAILEKNLRYSEAVMRRFVDLYRSGVVFDVVHASNWDLEAIALIRANVYPVVLMLVSPLAQVIQTEEWSITDDLRLCVAMDRWQIEHAHTVCVPSEGVLATYRCLMGIDTDELARLRKTLLGIVYAPTGRPLPHQRKMLLFVGRCERRKGVHVLLEVLPQLLSRHSDWECHLVGNDRVPLAEGGTLKDRFLQQYAHEHWCRRVVFHGEVSEDRLRQFYASCDLVVDPSLFESFGLVYHEAMQYGKAVVGCVTGGVPEAVEHGVEGLLVPPGDAESLREALATLMENDHLREQMGRAGAERIRKRHNHMTMARSLEQIYDETITAHAQECAEVRGRRWPKTIPLWCDDSQIRLFGHWRRREAVPGRHYLCGDAGAALEVELPSHSMLRITALRHAWSGILCVSGEHMPARYYDLYLDASCGLELDYPIDIGVTPDKGTGHTTVVKVQVHSERNPASYESVVWLHRLEIIPCSFSSVSSFLSDR